MDSFPFFNQEDIFDSYTTSKNKNSEKELKDKDELHKKKKEENSEGGSMNVTQEVVENNINKNKNLKPAFSEEKIKNILGKFGIIDKFDENFITPKDKKSVSLFEVKIKQKRNRNSNNKKKIKLLKKKGRKTKYDKTERLRGKNSSDNIIKKCKGIFFNYIIIYVNLIIKKYALNLQKNFELLNLSYESYVNNLKKENEMSLLNMSLKDFVSLDISSRYGFNLDFNQQKMKKILNDEQDNVILNSLLNMTFSQWIDVFTNKIENSFDFGFNGLQNVLNNLYNNEDDEYFSRFIFYLFNYQNWFQNKKGRKRKTKINSDEII